MIDNNKHVSVNNGVTQSVYFEVILGQCSSEKNRILNESAYSVFSLHPEISSVFCHVVVDSGTLYMLQSDKKLYNTYGLNTD